MSGEASRTFELRFAPTAAAAQRTPDAVIVHRTPAVGPGGHSIYTDATGIVRAEISDSGEVRMIATSGHQILRRPVACRLLPTPSPHSVGLVN